jgi:hypothetical protein
MLPFLLIFCSCSLPKEVEWGDCLAEVEFRNNPYLLSRMGIELQEINNNLIMIARTNKDLPDEIKTTKLADGKTFIIKTINKNYICRCQDDEAKQSTILELELNEEKTLWARYINSYIIRPDCIYDKNNNLLYIAILSLTKDSKANCILLLDPKDGKTLKTFTLDRKCIPRLPWAIDISDNLNFMIVTESVLTLERFFLFKRILGKNHFSHIGELYFPEDRKDGKILDYTRIDNDVAIISMQRGTRESFMTTQKIVFYDLRNNSTILEYNFTANAIIADAAISADRKYVVLIINTFGKGLVRLYKLKTS